jgi:hypothetical protein
MPTTAQRLAEIDYRGFYLAVLDAFLSLHPRHAGHRGFLERAMAQLHAFPVSRAAWRRVVGNEDALPDRPRNLRLVDRATGDPSTAAA